MTSQVGEVVAINGVKVTLRIDDHSSKEALFHQGDKYKGVAIREHLSIQRGFRDIVCLVEGEYLDESRAANEDGKVTFIRKVDVRPIGYFENGTFKHGIKFLPMIRDPAFLMREERISSIYIGSGPSDPFKIGHMLKEDIDVSLPWKKLFNSHIGIFGNTGSGKSNTLAKLYTVLFNEKLAEIAGKSNFVILDFNGEYAGEQLVPLNNKSVYLLSTVEQAPAQNNQSRFPLPISEFWDLETLSLLFQATANTQRPFLNRVIEGRRRFETGLDSLSNYSKVIFRAAFTAGQPNPATLDLARTIAKLLENEALFAALSNVNWHAANEVFYSGPYWFNPDGAGYTAALENAVNTIDVSNLDAFEQLILRVNLQLISDLISGYVQFEHIQPLLKRVESSFTSLRKVIRVVDEPQSLSLLSVISMRRCNNEIKKVLPLLFVKHFYKIQKQAVSSPPDRTMHLIVDEAHNILSEQSNRESESWKDYRLEQFEEIVKEGRKFGMFITVSSQRPADISPTIVSQLHNFFIHRLVNDRDLFLIDNTISSLDAISKSLIPNLSQGCCVITGTAFDLPMVVQVDRLPTNKQPASDDVNLEALWNVQSANDEADLT